MTWAVAKRASGTRRPGAPPASSGHVRDEEGFGLGRKTGLWLMRQEIVPEMLTDATVVVFDVLLATTTLLAIAEHGARSIRAVATLAEAEALRVGPDGPRILGGEQGGYKAPGMDRGPLPTEYPPEVVAGRDVVFVSTNGTPTLAAVAPARTVLLGCLRNAPAVARVLDARTTEDLYLICAGSRGHASWEDFLAAAAVLDAIADPGELNDAALIARDFGARHRGALGTLLPRGRVGRWLAARGYADVLAYAGEVGASDLVLEATVDGIRPVSAAHPARRGA
ncbi:MAG: 2-phosphosulfolactate phosphatase [Actinomycetia bacterium]|nr:2-phosphosulfolactate phosphatase [Actinomycetes bacterium]